MTKPPSSSLHNQSQAKLELRQVDRSVFGGMKVDLCKTFSVRNVLRASGVISLCVGAPMAVVPPLMVRLFFGKRDMSPSEDKNALNVTMQACGVALTASGAKSLVGPVSKRSLAAATYMEACYTIFHFTNRFCRMKDTGMNRNTATAFLCANLPVVGVQVFSLWRGDKTLCEKEA